GFAKGDSARTRGALVLLALTVPMLWSRLVFQLFAGPILEFDASVAASFLGTERVGNMVRLGDDSGYMAVIAPCSSLTNMALAFLCWVSVTQWVGRRLSGVDGFWGLLFFGFVSLINGVRIAVTGLSRSHYDIIHSPLGSTIWGFLILGLIVGLTLLSARREAFSRA